MKDEKEKAKTVRQDEAAQQFVGRASNIGRADISKRK